MPLSRLENFLRSPKGTIIYVDPNSFDATDSFENRGDSATRPFATLQRALIEAARFSYQQGLSNDLNDRTTILVSPGTHYIDNRPGLSITSSSGTAVYKRRIGLNQWTNDSLDEFNEDSDFDIFSPSNVLRKFNSVEGGVILPRGTSIVGYDLRKTKIRPLYVPDPEDSDVERSSIFKVTGNCYFSAFTFFDADPSNAVYKDYTDDLFVGKYSHHKLTAFTYADGVNKVKLGYEQTALTDLQMYYYKVANAYGITSGRDIPDYPSTIDIEPVIDEYRIVGILDENLLGISSIRSGNGTGGGSVNEITVTTKNIITNLVAPHNLTVNTPILISGISTNAGSYNGSFLVNSVVGPNTFTYITPSTPGNAGYVVGSQYTSNALIRVESDTTSSSSPYILNCSLRSNYGMCGLWADGSKADGFKSIVVAQFTGISLQRDDNAFLIYSQDSKNYKQNSQLSSSSTEKPLHTNPYAIYNPEYENFHIRVSNNSFIQCVSIFAIGYAKHFVTESGGDMSITNSNSNFGALALESDGFRNTSFDRDDAGFITHIIPPRAIPFNETDINWLPIDVGLTTATSNSSNKRLYLFGYNDINALPPFKIDGYRVGAKDDELLYLEIGEGGEIFESPVLMDAQGSEDGPSARKEYKVAKDGNNNAIGNQGAIEFETTHRFKTGEKVRIYSSNGQLPDGLEANTIYYAIRVDSNEIKLALNYNDAIALEAIEAISNNGGDLTIVSSVSDMKPGDVGHPIQWDSVANNWYVISSTQQSKNNIYKELKDVDIEEFGESTLLTTFKRRTDSRSIEERLYKVRYVIPKDYLIIREPTSGFVLQETKSTGLTTKSVDLNSELRVSDKRNEKIIKSISAGAISNNSQIVTLETENPHKFSVGDVIKVSNVKSSNNPSATGITSTFNGSYEVSSIINSRKLTYSISGVSTNPGTFSNVLTTRNENTISTFPTVSREKLKNTFVVYKVETIKKHIPGLGGQDGVYHLTLLSSNSRTNSSIGYGLSEVSYNQEVRDLYPQIDRDNYIEDPYAAVSYADHNVLGRVITNNKKYSLTKESIEYLIENNNLGFGITGITLSGTGNTTITINTEVEHKLNSIKKISINDGEVVPTGTYYALKVFRGNTETDALVNIYNADGTPEIEIVDGGSNFTDNSAIKIQIPGSNDFIDATVRNVPSSRRGVEMGGHDQPEFNDLFRIINVSEDKKVVLQSTKELPDYIPNKSYKKPFGIVVSDRLNISSGTFSDIATGIVTITTNTPHGLVEGNGFKIIGSGHTDLYDSKFTVNSVIGINTFNFNIGIATINPSFTSGIVYKTLLSSNDKSTGRTGENLANRINYIYAGISTIITNLDNDSNSLSLSSSGFDSSGFERGDYIQINNEIIRLTQKTGADEWAIERGMFGTLKNNDISEETRIQKIKVIPVELRRPSFIRASGHTFEYLGYGPGNYSTSVPQKQTRKLTDSEIIVSQSRKKSGGTVVYSGMNDIGEFYYGAKKVSAITGQEVVVEAPIITYVGDDADGSDDPSRLAGIFDSLIVRQKITVEGGEDGTETTTFRGPVSFDKSISLKESFATPKIILNKKIIGVDLPNDKTYDNSKKEIKAAISFNKNTNINSPSGIGNTSVGLTYILNEWRRWGLISKSASSWDVDLDKLNVKELTINGTTFGDPKSFDTLTLKNLTVTGVSSFRDYIYGRQSDNTVLIADNLAVFNPNLPSSTIIEKNGLNIKIGINEYFTNYGLRIARTSSGIAPDSLISHRGAGKLTIQSEDSAGSILVSSASTNGKITVSSGSTIAVERDVVISVASSTTNIFKIEKNINASGSAGAHFSIQNNSTSTTNSTDAVLSWRAGANNRFWFAGVDSIEANNPVGINNSWKLGLSSSNVSITSQDFLSNNVYLTVTPEGRIGIGTNKPASRVHIQGTVTMPDGQLGIGTTNPSDKVHVIGNVRFDGDVKANSFSGNAVTNIINSISAVGIGTSEKVTTVKGVYNFVDNNYAKVSDVETPYVVLHVWRPTGGGSPLTGDASIPEGYGSNSAERDKLKFRGDNNGTIYQSQTFETVTEALNFASKTFVPYGAEIVISVHNDLSNDDTNNIPTSFEPGPLMIANGWSPVVVAGARGTVGSSISPKLAIGINTTTPTVLPKTRLPQFDFNILSSGIIFQDIAVDVLLNNINYTTNVGINTNDNYFLTFNGGFGFNKRNVTVRWIDPGPGNTLCLATGSYGEKIQFRILMPETPKVNIGIGVSTDDRIMDSRIVYRNTDNKINTNATLSGFSTTTTLSVLGQAGGIAGQGVNILFDFRNAGYGQTTTGSNLRNRTFGFSFNTNRNTSRSTKLGIVNLGGRGNCTMASRVGPQIIWNFNGKFWDFTDAYTGFNQNFNIASESFRTLPFNTYNGIVGLTNYTGIKYVEFNYGSRLWIGGGRSGLYSLYSELVFSNLVIDKDEDSDATPVYKLFKKGDVDGWLYYET